MAQVAIHGNTYPVKDELKAIGAKWDADQKCWTITAAKADQARKLVEAAPAQKPPTPGICVKCKGSVKAPYIICFACKNKGKCLNCGVELDDYARRKGYKRCLDCVDGGGNANGGMSYYDRNGRFVLGDDD
jgi:hypothetical protein